MRALAGPFACALIEGMRAGASGSLAFIPAHGGSERVLDELSFEATEIGAQTVTITAAYVRERIGDLLADQDLSRHIL